MPTPSEEELIAEWSAHLRHMGFPRNDSESMAQQICGYILANEPLTHPREMSSEEKADAREIFEGAVDGIHACYHCGGIHVRVNGLLPEQQPCPRIKRIKRHTDGTTILDVEYWPNGEWESDVVFPADVYGDDETEDDE